MQSIKEHNLKANHPPAGGQSIKEHNLKANHPPAGGQSIKEHNLKAIIRQLADNLSKNTI
ncbi:MAG: hypothetical protein KF775_19130 [Cyclobacteriaceae bacterium]|nr:hypothetical protein [Cyclobacteriaceae bacterium]